MLDFSQGAKLIYSLFNKYLWGANSVPGTILVLGVQREKVGLNLYTHTTYIKVNGDTHTQKKKWGGDKERGDKID